MKLSKLFKTLGLTTVLAISSSAILLVQPKKSIADPLCRTVYDSALANNQTLQPGDCVVSDNNSGSFTTSSLLNQAPSPYLPPSGYFLILQNDGNLVLYHFLNQNIKAIWASGTNGQTVTEVIMQADGNLVIYGPSGALWASGTNGHPNSTLVVQNDGNMVIYQGSVRIWATNTNQ